MGCSVGVGVADAVGVSLGGENGVAVVAGEVGDIVLAAAGGRKVCAGKTLTNVFSDAGLIPPHADERIMINVDNNNSVFFN
jgi:hypothetical protein